LSWSRSRFDSAAKVGQSERPSAMMGWIFRPPSSPPEALISAIASSSAWATGISLMAIVPVKE
jgi:hypothetical protein